jgi:hypothetical protein
MESPGAADEGRRQLQLLREVNEQNKAERPQHEERDACQAPQLRKIGPQAQAKDEKRQQAKRHHHDGEGERAQEVDPDHARQDGADRE